MFEKFNDLSKNKILLLDGAMGTMIQRLKLNENDFKGESFKNWKKPLIGNNDILNLSKGNVIYDIHTEFLESGSDILETNTFNSTKISQADYGSEEFSYDLNFEGARLARKAVDDFLIRNPGEVRFVAGVLGPTNRTCSMSPDVNDPGFRNITFDQLKTDYKISIEALIKGGSDFILIETIFDTLNAKAALMAIYEQEQEQNKKIHIMVSATITDLSGRTLSGQTLEGFYNSIIHSQPISVGLNCALGPKELDPYVAELSRISETNVSVHPNAGLPNAFGEYDETPESMGEYAKKWGELGYLNIIGGCCGTTPDHIAVLKDYTKNIAPRVSIKKNNSFRLSGLEKFNY